MVKVKENINIALSALVVSIDSLKNDPKNARTHGKRSIESIKRSLEDFGMQKPVIALPDGTVIAGNGVLQAAEELGWTKIAVVVFSDISKAREYALQDNRTAELSTWDDDILRGIGTINLKELSGFDDKFLKKHAGEKPEPKEKTKHQVQCPNCQTWVDIPKRKRKEK